jgi:hypothetical protein
MAGMGRSAVPGSAPGVTSHPTGRRRKAEPSSARAGHHSYSGKVASATVFLASGAALVPEVVG